MLSRVCLGLGISLLVLGCGSSNTGNKDDGPPPGSPSSAPTIDWGSGAVYKNCDAAYTRELPEDTSTENKYCQPGRGEAGCGKVCTDDSDCNGLTCAAGSPAHPDYNACSYTCPDGAVIGGGLGDDFIASTCDPTAIAKLSLDKGYCPQITPCAAVWDTSAFNGYLSQRQGPRDFNSWSNFIALNWPADPNNRGDADSSAELGAFGTDGQSLQTVWMDFATPEETFGVSTKCPGKKDVLAMSSKVDVDPGSFVVPAEDGYLIDQSGSETWYEVRINQPMFEYITKQPSSAAKQYWQPGVPYMDASFPYGSLEIKAAWKKLSSAEASAKGFVTKKFTLYDEVNDTCIDDQTMGLVALHIITKFQEDPPQPSGCSALKGSMRWNWATFVHRANNPVFTGGGGPPLTEFENLPPGFTSWNFYDPACKGHVPSDCSSYEIGKDNPSDYKCCPNLLAYNEANPPPATGAVPTQLAQIMAYSQSQGQCALGFLDRIKDQTSAGANNVLQNYLLLATQWPDSFRSNASAQVECFSNVPATLRNPAVEVFGGTSTSCMGCHDGGQDGSFIFLHRPSSTSTSSLLQELQIGH
jgi:hypothetical protein